jgi:hypothetical protein
MPMAELKITGIRVVQEGAAEVKAELLSVGEAGDKSAQKVAASFQSTAQAATQSAQQMTVAQRAAAQLGVSLDQVAAAANGDAAAMRALTAATQQSTVAANQNAAAMARMSAPSVTFRREVEQTGDAIRRMSAPAVSGFRQIEEAVVATTRMAAPAVTGFRQLAVAQESAATAAGVHGLQLGRIAQESGTAAGRVLGLNTAMTRFSAMLGGSIAGYGPTIALVGAVVLLGEAYKKLTEGEREAAEQQERLNKARQEFIDKQARPAGQLGTAQTNLSESVASDAKKIADMTVQRDSLLSQGAIEKANTLNEKIIALTTTYAKNAAELRVMTDETDRLTNASKEAAQQAALEAEHQSALNAAYGQSSVVVARINADYKLRSDLLRDAAQYVGEERVQMDAAAQAARDAAVAAAQNAAGVGELRSKTAELNAALPTLQAGFESLAPAVLYVNHLWQDQVNNAALLVHAHDDIKKSLDALAQKNEQTARKQVNETADQIKAQERYAADMERIWRDGFARIAVDGTQSFARLTEDIFRLVSRLEDRIAHEGNGSLLDGLKKLWGGSLTPTKGVEAGIGGALAGFNSGSAGGGLISGAIAGFASGGGPWGAVIGGLAGLTASLFGGGEAAKQRKQAEDQLRDSLTQSLTKIRVQMGQLPEIEGQIADAQAQFAARAKQIDDAYSGKKNQTEREQLLAANSKLEQEYIAWLRKQDEATKAATKAAEEAAAAQQALADAQKNASAQGNYQLRFLNATGQSDAAFNLGQQLELDQAIADGLDAISIRLLTQAQAAEKAQREQQKQTQLLQDQLSAAQQQYDALKQVYDSLTAFKSSLAIGQYSPLSPRQQLDAARGQLNTLYQAALGGDQAAAGQFSGAAQSFLDASRRYNASGAGYVLDYNSVNVMTDKLTEQFGRQMTDAQKQVSLLQQQLDVLKSIDASTITLAQRPLTPSIPTPTPVGGSGPRIEAGAGADASVAVTAAGFNLLSAKLDTLTIAVETNTTLTTRKLDSLTSATANRRTA